VSIRATVKLDREGIGEVLRSPEMAVVVYAAAQRIAGRVSHSKYAQDMDVIVDIYVTDRVAAAVFLAGEDSVVTQAEHGILTRAAAELGAEVHW
jgi:hypothetical protein